ncbi:MAG: trehalose-phosphatase [Candidatus Thermoplasmatota archaeon]
MTKPLSKQLHKISKKIENTEQCNLFLDYDGSLVSFKNRPEEVYTPEKIKQTLGKIPKKIHVLIITGRNLEEIKKLLPMEKISFAATHGIQIKLEGKEEYVLERAKKTQPLLKKIKKHVEEKFEEKKDVIVEDKKYTLALHYRQLPDREANKIVEKFKNIVKKYDRKQKLEFLHGSKVIEIRPKGWDKGKAVEHIQKTQKEKADLNIYIGDDVTDEDAFRYLRQQDNNITIYVKNDSDIKTNAEWWVKNPEEVYHFLEEITEL